MDYKPQPHAPPAEAGYQQSPGGPPGPYHQDIGGYQAPPPSYSASIDPNSQFGFIPPQGSQYTNAMPIPQAVAQGGYQQIPQYQYQTTQLVRMYFFL